jgi:hypothetical protein
MWYLATMPSYSAIKKNEMLSFINKWMELENIILSTVKLARLRSPKAPFFPLYANCKHKTNGTILWDMDHTKESLGKGQIKQGKETKNMNNVDVLTVQK